MTQKEEQIGLKNDSSYVKNNDATDQSIQQSFQDMTIPELLNVLKELVNRDDIYNIRPQVEEIKTEFYKTNKQLYHQAKQDFVDNGGKIEDFVFDNSAEKEFKDLYSAYKSKRDAYNTRIAKEEEENLAIRKELITELEKLINTEETLQHTFDIFRTIQKKWKKVGAVPAKERKKIWETYHIQLARFYDYIKINKELRDLDLRKNHEAKIELCEKAEALTQEKSIIKAFNKLQDLHEKWRETGPVHKDVKDDLWNRFKAATTIINKAHQDYFKSLKEKEKDNLEAKIKLCEKVEDINSRPIKTIKIWKKASEEVIDIQKEWKKIGFAPQKYNTSIYERFSSVCDLFFTTKREFFKEIHDIEKQNLEKKLNLCEKAEKMKDRTDWSDAKKDFIELQKEWKETGSVPKKDSNTTWKRFSSACDYFFSQLKEHFAHLHDKNSENVETKKAIIEKIKSLSFSDNVSDNLHRLKELQKEWNAIGPVPESEKNALYAQYNSSIHEKYNELDISEEQKQAELYHIKLENLKEKDASRIRTEQNKLKSKKKSLQDELLVLENNKGFFNISDSSSNVLASMNAKIDKYKKDIEKINEQLRIIRRIEHKN
ncbi:MAG: DUF349 domain-containing protein [Bacteroidales bacterium]